ncbi:glucokinase [Acetobacter estunensis NRIC 0472]|uniref:Glucokinase n=1 Tax=Acetobacter estunensis TaxID=104097 RepID=A0A967EDI3_9PROT|nr:glucokinase [Acetobacter estunensis]NHO54321.1 glucokinase [Acetobacter estunensis]GBQ21228.1 glucokinase [Acetobacter estunensis NRIC 0472]
MQEIIAADIGGTHARFTLARVGNGCVHQLDTPFTVAVADHETLQDAWTAFARHIGKPLPHRASIALACPARGEVLIMANNPWSLVRAELPGQLDIDPPLLLNDFEAVAHAVAGLDTDHLPPLCGPDRPLPMVGTILVIGPGTGLGTAAIVRQENGPTLICGAEGGHIGFAPCDTFEDRLLERLRAVHGRVSAERVISGPGIIPICAQISDDMGETPRSLSDKQIWTMALEGHDRIAVHGMERFCQALGSFAGDMALAHGATGLVVAGGLGKRLTSILPTSDFGARFVAKGRFESMMRRIPVRMIDHPEPGLFGAASALAVKLSQEN